MKTVFFGLSAFAAFGLSLMGQGNLNPPGAPTATMKTLDQVYGRLDPRIPITNSTSFSISQPGSYYLTTNITVATGNAVTINASQVTLDLNGFTIASTSPSPSGYAINLPGGNTQVTILNGHIKSGVTNNGGIFGGSGFNGGIVGFAPVSNIRVTGVSVVGCLNYGIALNTADSTIIDSCSVRTAGAYGIEADIVKDCIVSDCGTFGIYGTIVSDSRADASGTGIFCSVAVSCFSSTTNSSAIVATVIQNCYGTSVSGTGLQGGEVHNSYGNSSAGYGIDGNVVLGSYGVSTTGSAGLRGYDTSFSAGYRTSGTAIQSIVATGSSALSGTNSITFKYNMP